MASGQWTSGPASKTTTATTAFTLVLMKAGTATGFEAISWEFSTDGALVGNYKIELCQGTAATAGTPGATPTAIGTGQSRASSSLAFSGSIGNAYSAEPTVLTPIDQIWLPAGALYRFPLGERQYVPPGTTFSIRVTPPGTTSSVCTAQLFVED